MAVTTPVHERSKPPTLLPSCRIIQTLPQGEEVRWAEGEGGGGEAAAQRRSRKCDFVNTPRSLSRCRCQSYGCCLVFSHADSATGAAAPHAAQNTHTTKSRGRPLISVAHCHGRAISHMFTANLPTLRAASVTDGGTRDFF